MSSPRYKPGDQVVCRSDFGVEGLVTPGKQYEILKPEGYMSLVSALGLGMNSDLLITIMCDDGKPRGITKLRFVPATEIAIKRGKLELVRLKP
jgi:hypothetical protein